MPAQPNLMESFLSISGATQAVRFAPKDNDDLNSDLLAGRFDRVIFASREDLLEAIWDGDADLAGWKSRGVRIEVMAHEGHETTLTDLSEDDDLPRITAHYRNWRAARLRRKMAAAAAISTALIASLAAFFMAGVPKS